MIGTARTRGGALGPLTWLDENGDPSGHFDVFDSQQTIASAVEEQAATLDTPAVTPARLAAHAPAARDRSIFDLREPGSDPA
jgi:hypothetical protein